MRSFVLVSLAALGSAASLPAQAAVIVNGDNSVTFNNVAGTNSVDILFNGLGGDPKALVPGLTATLTLTLNSIVGNAFNFGYSLKNTSSVTSARVSGIGFNVSPDVTGVSSTGVFDNYGLGGFTASFVSETCFWGGNNSGNQDCPQSNGGQPGNFVAPGATGTGTLSLIFSSPEASITLNNFLDRYQGFDTDNVDGNNVTSAVGRGTPVRGGGVTPPAVPEPATWATMILGFGLVGAAMRRRRLTLRHGIA